MAHTMSFVALNEPIVGGVLRVQLRVDPDPAYGSPMDWSGLACHFTWDPTALEFLGIDLADEEGELPGIWELLPTVGFYKRFNEAYPPSDGDGYYCLLGPLQRDPVFIPAEGGICETFDFKVKTAATSHVRFIPSRTVTWADGSTYVDATTGVFRGTVAGLMWGVNTSMPDRPEFHMDDDWPMAFVDLEVVPDATQAPPPTPEEVLINNIAAAIEQHAPTAPPFLLMTIKGHIDAYLAG